MQQSHGTSPGILKWLLAAAAAALLACLVVVGLMASSILPATRSTILSVVAAMCLVALAFALMLYEVLVRRPRREVLEEPLEMSTLTFPPSRTMRAR